MSEAVSKPDVDVKEIEEALNKITSGNWHVQPGEHYDAVYSSQETTLTVVASKTSTEDAYFIANAPKYIRQLLTKLAETQVMLDEMTRTVAELAPQLAEAEYRAEVSAKSAEIAAKDLVDAERQINKAVETLEEVRSNLKARGGFFSECVCDYIDEALQSIKGDTK